MINSLFTYKWLISQFLDKKFKSLIKKLNSLKYGRQIIKTCIRWIINRWSCMHLCCSYFTWWWNWGIIIIYANNRSLQITWISSLSISTLELNPSGPRFMKKLWKERTLETFWLEVENLLLKLMLIKLLKPPLKKLLRIPKKRRKKKRV